MKAALSMAASALLLLSSEARACYTADGHRALIHSALPTPLPADMIVAEVEFPSEDLDALLGRGIPVRVTRVVQGEVPGDRLVVRMAALSSCDRPFENGGSGFLIAMDRSMGAKWVIVEPFTASRAQGYRLADGERIPDEWRRLPYGW